MSDDIYVLTARRYILHAITELLDDVTVSEMVEMSLIFGEFPGERVNEVPDAEWDEAMGKLKAALIAHRNFLRSEWGLHEGS